MVVRSGEASSTWKEQLILVGGELDELITPRHIERSPVHGQRAASHTVLAQPEDIDLLVRRSATKSLVVSERPLHPTLDIGAKAQTSIPLQSGRNLIDTVLSLNLQR